MGIALFSLCIISILSAMLFSYGALKRNAHEISALSVVKKKVENLMNIQYSSLSTASNYYDEPNVLIDSATGLRGDIDAVVTSGGTNKKRITVAVSWNEAGRDFRISLDSLSSKHNVTSKN